MINVKLALSALLAEIASWSSLWLLHNHSDAALLSYLAAHALASVLLALCLSPFLVPAADAQRQRLPLVALMALLSYAVPVVGFVGSVIATVALHRRRGFAARKQFSSLPLPEFDPHQQAGGSRRQVGLQSFLANQAVPVPLRMRSLAALGHVSGRIASPMLRMALSDSSDDLRLLAYSMLDAQERQLSQSIHQELQALERARAVEGGAAGPRGLQAAWALSDLYWELIYQGSAQGDVRDHAIQQSLHYCDQVLAQRPDAALLLLRKGRLLHLLADGDGAQSCYQRALDLGLPAARVIPYQAELLFEQRQFAKVQELMCRLEHQQVLPRLRPCIQYWSAP